MIFKNLAIGAAVLAALVLLGLGFHAWLSEHDARKDAEATAKQAQATIAASQKSIDDRDALLKQQQDALAKQQAAVTTAPQAVKIITQQIPAIANTPPPVVVQKADLPPVEQAKLPDAPSYAIFTQEQVVAVAKNELQCKSDQAALSTCKADLADKSAQIAAAQKDAAAWEKAAKGTLWGNVLHAVKCVGLSAGGAAVGALSDKQNPGMGAGIGAGAGAVACSLWK